jgi:two-component sensor histidine kinase
VHLAHTALADADTLLQTLAGASRDLRRGREHADLLLSELAHRAKNQLAVVNGMAQQTARRRGSVEEFVVFTRRLEGLARSQDVLVSQSWKGASMRDLVLAHLDLIGAEVRVQLDGPELYLDSAAVQNVGFALTELGTNAAKYGALSIPHGRVTIRWTGPVAGNIHLYWHEQGGPPVAAPTSKALGCV